MNDVLLVLKLFHLFQGENNQQSQWALFFSCSATIKPALYYLILLWSAYSHPKNLNFSTFQANSFFSHANGRKILQELHTESKRNSAHRSWQLLLMTLITKKQFFMKLGHKIWILPNQRISNVYYVNFSSVASLLTRRLNADTNVTPTLGRGRDVGWSTATRLPTQRRAATYCNTTAAAMQTRRC